MAFRYVRLNPEDKEIRVLKANRSIPRRASQRHLLDFSLIHVSLNSEVKPKYHALSYVWGNPAKVFPILLNDTLTSITQNLGEALKRLWKEDIEFLWADGLCIDQSKGEAALTERNAQVQMMDEVYKEAEAVWAWLGLADNHSEIVMNEIATGGGKIIKHALGPFSWMRGAQTTLDGFNLGILALVDVEANVQELLKDMNWASGCHPKSSLSWKHFLACPYWRRGWILQEVLLSRQCFLVCGDAISPIGNLLAIQALASKIIPGMGDAQFDLQPEYQNINDTPLNSFVQNPILRSVKDVVIWNTQQEQKGQLRRQQSDPNDPEQEVKQEVKLAKEKLHKFLIDELIALIEEEMEQEIRGKGQGVQQSEAEISSLEIALLERRLSKELPQELVKNLRREQRRRREIKQERKPEQEQEQQQESQRKPRLTLLQLLKITHDLQTSDPRDKIYALISIAGDILELGIKVDYNQSPLNVYVDVMQRLLLQNGPEILSLPIVNGLSSKWPSWVTIARCLNDANSEGFGYVPIRTPRNMGNSHDFLFSASGNSVTTLCKNSFSNSGLLYISSYVVGDISEEYQVRWKTPPKDDKEDFEIAKVNIEGFHKFAEKLGCSDRLWWLPILHRDPDAAPQDMKAKYHSFHMQVYTSYLALFGHPEAPDNMEQSVLYRTIFKIMSVERSIFITSNGYIGIGPRVQQGDIVVICPGVSVPWILRPNGSGRCRFQGEAYVLGVMHGEFLRTNRTLEHFEIE